MKYAEISALSDTELVKRKRDLQATIFEGRMKKSLGQLGNYRSIRHAKRDVARINTALAAKAALAPTKQGKR